ncbi:regulatory LuxR family protein [Gelidibacter algens]|uniref:Regulatory LuxR family protein n=2 Tax=Gelidibacter algens TaxID=49280 RepID=A0A327SEU0_9FLAO|nr:LuxR C-terminal-related transcriptional regulator [Gelidibacter algens]RAJ26444.1 regulatory LuxR family protein [Gelidibacter algens]
MAMKSKMPFLLPSPFVVVLFCCLFFQSRLEAQYSPYFQNYDLSQYNAGNQNWGISKAEDGRLYVANNKGLLEFDGLKWTLNVLPNKTTIRSVLAVDKKIYIGSYEEFGFWERDKFGTLNYTSISKDLDPREFLNQEFWQIISTDDAIIFRSFLNIYIFRNGVIKKIEPPSTVMSCNVIDGTLYIATLTNGILSLQNGDLKPFIEHGALVDTKIVSISKTDGAFFITTSLEGIFTYAKGVLKPWTTEITAIVKEHQLNVFTEMENGNMVFGTIQNGVYVTNPDGQIKFHIHKENGLINNTVLSQYIDENDQLWMGLDNGLASADLKSPYLFYNDVSGKLGAVYDVINYKNTVYIGSNTGLFYLDQKNTLQFIDGSQGQVWDLTEIEGDLFCGHNNGTYIVEDKKLKLISQFTGGWVIRKVVDAPRTYIQGTYAGLVKFKKESTGWTVKQLGGTTIPSRFLVFEDAYTAWVAHAYKGLYKIKFSKSYDSILDIKNYEHKGLSSTYNVRVYKLKNDISIKTNNGWQKYEPLLDTIVPYDLLNTSFGKNSYIISENDVTTLAVKNQNSINFKTFPEDGFKASLSDKYFKKRLIVGYENVSQLKDDTQALSLDNGFMLFDTSLSAESNVLQKPYFEGIEIDQQRIALNAIENIELPNNFKTFTIALTAPKSKDHFFEYTVASMDAVHWYKIENETLDLSNISYGTYEFLFRASNHLGETSANQKLMVTVLPPWYRTAQGYLFFAFILALILILFYVLHRRKIEKEQKLLQIKFAEKQNELIKEKNVENQRHIVELKNESLKNEVKLKSKQLANTAMALVKKNETLLELKKEISIHKNTFDNYISYKNIIKKIDTSIGHKDEWKVFEYNFNQVHEEFFKQLKGEHPNLTSKDLRVCAYIKMNLSTKEIAPLLNISIRGVETQRYRLKNKLKLNSDKSLTDYLLNFK